METLDKHFRALAGAAFKAHGFAQGDLLAHWRDIAGESMASLCTPERIKWPKPAADGSSGGATLSVKVAAGRSLDVQYAAATLIERINQFLGYQAVTKIKIVGTLAPPTAKTVAATPPVPPPLEKLANIADPALKDALARLGSAVLSDPAKPRSPQGS